ncbi:MAG: PD-(D/E)XK nuclease domain-containing protein [Spirochaetota bacterium]
MLRHVSEASGEKVVILVDEYDKPILDNLENPKLALDKSGDKRSLAQLQERGYAEKYRSDGRPLHQAGIVFDAESRNIEGWETE